MKIANNNFLELESKGYTVIQNFINPGDLEACLQRYNSCKDYSLKNGITNKNYRVFQDTQPHVLRNQIYQLLELVRQNTNITTDFVRPRADYFDTEQQLFPWHQDHEPYYQFQDNYNFLSCWIPLIKPDANQTGLTFLPFDQLNELCPDLVTTRFLTKGAKKLYASDNSTLVKDDEEGDTISLPFNIEDIGESPTIGVGDLLLFRCDAIHKTQDNNTHRVSMSIRCLNLTGKIYKEQFNNRCPVKQTMMNANSKTYTNIANKFKNTNNDYITVADTLN